MRATALLAACCALLAVVVAPGAAAFGQAPATPAAATADTTATVTGTVQTTTGGTLDDGYVVAVPAPNASMLETVTPQTILGMAENDTDDDVVRAAAIGDDGGYSLTVPNGTYHVVATDGVNVSAGQSLEVGEGTTEADLTVAPVTNLSVSASASSPTPGTNATVLVRARNEVGNPLGEMTLTVESLPDGWELVDATTEADGTVSDDGRRFAWPVVPHNSEAPGTLTLAVPDDVEPGTYEVVVRYQAGDVTVTERTVEVEVVSAATTTAPGTTTTTPLTSETGTTPGTTTTEDEGSSGIPGFTAGAALAAVALLAVLARRRR
jgi:PGF-CTERM protein